MYIKRIFFCTFRMRPKSALYPRFFWSTITSTTNQAIFFFFFTWISTVVLLLYNPFSREHWPFDWYNCWFFLASISFSTGVSIKISVLRFLRCFLWELLLPAFGNGRIFSGESTLELVADDAGKFVNSVWGRNLSVDWLCNVFDSATVADEAARILVEHCPRSVTWLGRKSCEYISIMWRIPVILKPDVILFGVIAKGSAELKQFLECHK